MIALSPPEPIASRFRRWTRAEKILLGLLFCVFFFVIEQLAGSSLAFSFLVAVYAGMALVAVRAVGGIQSFFGVVVFWYANQHVLFCQVVKAFIGESPEARIPVPIPTIVSEILVLMGFCAAGLIVKHIKPNRDRPLFPPVTDPDALQRLAVASTLLALVRLAGTASLQGDANFLRLVGVIDFIAVAAAIGATVTRTGGRRLTSPLVWCVLTPFLLFSMIGGARQGYFNVVAAIALAGWAFGYRFRLQHYAFGAAALWFMFFVLSPYGLAVRSQARTDDFFRNLNIAQNVFFDVLQDPEKYQVKNTAHVVAPPDQKENLFYFVMENAAAADTLNRYALIKLNGEIVRDTLKTGTTGWANITPGWTRTLPGFFIQEKTFMGTGNMLFHRVGGLTSPQDYTTGITIGMTADAFSAFGYWGAFFLPMGVLALTMIVLKIQTRLDLRKNVFALAPLLQTAHSFSEATIASVAPAATYSLLVGTLVFFVTTRCANLLDFRHVRPRAVSPSEFDVDPVLRA